MPDGTPRQRFVYQQRTPDDVERQIRRAAFPEAMRQAESGNLEPLRALLPAEQAGAIIDFMNRRLRRDLIKRLPSPEREAENAIAALARYRIKLLQRRFGKLPRGTYQRVIDWSAADLAEDGELNRSDPERIDWKRIMTAVGRGKAKRQ
jgi:hypothetical protein